MTEFDSTKTAEYIISRLQLALEFQKRRSGDIAEKPTVTYCFECDDITVDSFSPRSDGCLDHTVVSSDGYECGGVQTAISVLEFVTNDLGENA